MKISDYIVEYLIEQGVTDIFGYPGGMVTHLMGSLSKYRDMISTHLTYHEQGAAFAACGYSQASNKLGVAFATSGPGATNLVTGICNAYFDSIPVLFITGQVNTFESKRNQKIRQCGFQETDIVSIVHKVTKYAAYVDEAKKIRWYLDRAVYEALHGRKGGVLLDIPMDIMKSDINTDKLEPYISEKSEKSKEQIKGYVDLIIKELKEARHPVILIGQGVKLSNSVHMVREFISRNRIPTVSSMLSVDVIDNNTVNYGFIGAYGTRTANFIVAKSDLLISFGARLDIRQVGKNRERFAPDSKIIRVEIDKAELDYKVHSDEIAIHVDMNEILSVLAKTNVGADYSEWNQICEFIKKQLYGMDDRVPNICVRNLSKYIPEDTIITTDVGQNQVWISQSFQIKKGQKILFSGSNGAMGYSLPAAIGAAAATGKTVFSFHGDGGIQMNMQELQTIAREKLPIKIIIFNNRALGMIRHFQEMYFEKDYFLTVEGNGYSNPDFEKIADAYDLPYVRIEGKHQKHIQNPFNSEGAEIIEVIMHTDTYVFPKLEYGKENQDQEPLLDRKLYNLLMNDGKIKKALENRRNPVD